VEERAMVEGAIADMERHHRVRYKVVVVVVVVVVVDITASGIK